MKSEIQKFDIAQLEYDDHLKIRASDEMLACTKRIFAAGEKFFRLDKSVKQKNAAPQFGDEGWTDLGYEYNIDPERPDLSEGFWVAPKYAKKTEPIYREALDLFRAMLEYTKLLNKVTREITEKLVQYLNLPDSFAANFKFEHDSEAELLYYKPSSHDRDLLQDPHEDGLYLTYLKPIAPGLQLLVDGEYQDAQLREDEILVMPGEILALMTADRIRPLFHQVKRYEGYDERFSLAYFTFPELKGSKLNPWIRNERNKGVDITEVARRNAYEKFALSASERPD
ncbi:MAG: 2OG-Fe(II) oxygenase family protein [bacterium]|nr:2OG-Fe(II) oxygenase family protein [bacterium]